MEDLGLGAYQSETQYLDPKNRVIAKWRQSGYMYPLLYPLPVLFVEKRRQRGDKYPLRKSLSSIIQSACREIGCNYQAETTRHNPPRENFAVSGESLLKDTILKPSA
jgi:hypothetical protein